MNAPVSSHLHSGTTDVGPASYRFGSPAVPTRERSSGGTLHDEALNDTSHALVASASQATFSPEAMSRLHRSSEATGRPENLSGLWRDPSSTSVIADVGDDALGAMSAVSHAAAVTVSAVADSAAAVLAAALGVASTGARVLAHEITDALVASAGEVGHHGVATVGHAALAAVAAASILSELA